MKQLGVALALMTPALLLRVPSAPQSSAAPPPAASVEELKQVQARAKHLAAAKTTARVFAEIGAVGPMFEVSRIAAGTMERYRTDQYTVYLIPGGGSYHASDRCSALRRSRNILPATLTNATELGRRPCLKCGPPD